MNSRPESGLYRFFFEKTTFCILSTIFLIFVGVLAYNSMVKEANPDLEIPQALIFTEWPGASPELVEKEITSKIEERIKSLRGLKRYRSGSSNTVSTISVEFNAEESMSESLQLLRSKVSEAEAYLPKNAKKPYVEPILVTDFPIITFLLYGGLENEEISIAANKLKNRLLKVLGVKKITIDGSSKKIVQIRLKPENLSALKISPYLVTERIKSENIDIPWGLFNNPDFKASFELAGRFQSLKEIKKLPIIRLNQSNSITVEDIADVEILQNQESTKAYFSKKGTDYTKSVALSVYKLPGKDSIRLIKKIKKAVDEVKKSSIWLDEMKIETTADESILINSQLKTVFNNVWQAMLAVSLVLFIMLSWREAIVASLAVPVTFLGAIALIWLLGYTINEMVIIGMVISLGLLIDSFILMMEGMHEAIFIKKMPPLDAVLYTLKTYASPLFSGIMTTIVVFFPLMTIGGVEGKFIRLIPVTAAICLALSYFIAVFIATPIASMMIDFKSHKVSQTRVDRLNEKISAYLSRWLKKFAIPNKKVALSWCLGTIVLFIFSTYCITLVPNELYPKADGRKLGITVEFSIDTSLNRSQFHAEKLGEILKDKPYFDNVSKFVGMKSPFSLNSLIELLSETHAPYLIGFSCVFTPKSERTKLGYEYTEEIRHELHNYLKNVPGAVLTMTPGVGGSSAEDSIQIEVTGKEMALLRQISLDIQNKLKRIPGVNDVRDNIGQARRFIKFKPKREAMNFYNITLADMSFQIRLAMSTEKLGKFRMSEGQEDLEIWIGTGWSDKKNELGDPTSWDELSTLAIVNERGSRIPIMSLVEPEVVEAPLAIIHRNGARAITIMAKNSKKTVNRIFKELVPQIDEMKKNWPVGYEYHLSGEVEAAAETYKNMFKAFGIGLFLIFAILALLFDSFKQPIIIMFSILFALIGTFCGFFLCWIPVSFPAMFGIVSLIGIVVNDAIVMIDTMNTHLKKGLSLIDAAAHGASDRLRPILSTTITTSIGLIPLSLSSPMWMPLCNAIIFGLITATIFSILLIPCLYVLLTPVNKISGKSAE